jgi:hypothetical protein
MTSLASAEAWMAMRVAKREETGNRQFPAELLKFLSDNHFREPHKNSVNFLVSPLAGYIAAAQESLDSDESQEVDDDDVVKLAHSVDADDSRKENAAHNRNAHISKMAKAVAWALENPGTGPEEGVNLLERYSATTLCDRYDAYRMEYPSVPTLLLPPVARRMPGTSPAAETRKNLQQAAARADKLDAELAETNENYNAAITELDAARTELATLRGEAPPPPAAPTPPPAPPLPEGLPAGIPQVTSSVSWNVFPEPRDDLDEVDLPTMGLIAYTRVDGEIRFLGIASVSIPDA